MIKKLSLTNFKSFKNLEELRFDNVTVLVGKNSSGKSSILQSLLLLKQTLASSSDNSPLLLEGNYLKYSNLNELTFAKPSPKKANIGYKFEYNFGNKTSIIEIKFKNKSTNDGCEIVVSDYSVKLSRKSKKFQFHKVSAASHIDLFKGKLPPVEGKPFEEVTGRKIIKTVYEKFYPEYYNVRVHTKKKAYELDLPIFLVTQQEELLNLSFRTMLSNIKYLSPVRAIPERAYVHYSQNVKELNDNGSNAAHVLWLKQNDEVVWRGKKQTLVQAVNNCFACMGLNQVVSPSRTGEIIYQVNMKENYSGKAVTLADVGFGYSQLLPVILIGLLSTDYSLILIEQPELHLHPSSAANLADLFLGFLEDNKYFIIETHSAEFINRLRLRVIENSELSKKINIVFVESSQSQGSQIQQFNIDENGMFPDWPEGFLDESEKLAQAMLNARLKKFPSTKKLARRQINDRG